MTRVNLNTAPPQVRKYICALPIAAGGVELEVDGVPVGTIYPPTGPTPEQRKELARERLQLMRKAQRRTRGVPAEVIEREVRNAIREVRRRKRS